MFFISAVVSSILFKNSQWDLDWRDFEWRPWWYLLKMCICVRYFYLNLKKHTYEAKCQWNNDTEGPASAHGLTQKSPLCYIFQAGHPGQLQWVYLHTLNLSTGPISEPFSMQEHARVRLLFTFYIIGKSINRWRLPKEEPVRGFSQENMFEPGDFISLSHITWLLNKITVSTPKGSHCARCVCLCLCVCVCVWATSGWCGVCPVSIWCLNIFQSGWRGCWSAEKTTRTPSLHTLIPVSYRKCAVNQKKLLVGAEKSLKGSALWQIPLFGNVEGHCWCVWAEPTTRLRKLTDYYDRVRALTRTFASVTSGCSRASAGQKVAPRRREEKERIEIEWEGRREGPKKKERREAVNERSR